MKLPEPLFVQVLSGEHRLTSRQNLPHWFLEMRVAIGGGRKIETIGKIWEPEKKKYLPGSGDILVITGAKDKREQFKSIDFEGYKKIEADQLPEYAKCVVHGARATDAELDESIKMISDTSLWTDKKNYRFIMGCLEALDKKKLRMCPAAKSMHHSFQGGLLVHTGEVVQYLRSIVQISASKYSFVDGDVLLGSGVMHDIGKVFTYDFDAYGNAIYLKEESTLGHLYCGMRWIQNMSELPKYKDISPKFIDDVLHCVASHHGELKHGSMREMQSLEARLLHLADVISSEQGKIHRELQEIALNDSELPPKIKIYENNYWVSDKMKEYIEFLRS